METLMQMKDIVAKARAKAYSYAQYRSLINDLRANGMATGGNCTEAFLNYTDLNNRRMDKWDKRLTIPAEIEAGFSRLDHQENWVLISEGWCGDAAHSVPVMAQLAELSNHINLEIVLRDENLDLMDAYLTNGGRSIPKLIRFDQDGKELGTWGPRPQEAQDLMLSMKNKGIEKAEINVELQKWYARDKGQSILRELAEEIL